ncbi:hypothetical protein ACI3KT_17970 [Microbacterium sp. ZW T6_19]|uniref:hypothetical protein n=1 Tax=Microbacterium sp. ZW T6_19 TaxID=3378082 RepID=UPI003853FBD3
MSASWWRTDAVVWSAGEWSLELRGDELAEIRHHDAIVLRGVRAAVRDRGWQTVPVLVTAVTAEPDALTVSLRHEGLGALLDSTLRATVHGGELMIAWAGVNQIGFDACRIGLVALHPASDSGRPAVVVHTDGAAEDVVFPGAISPHQPIRDIRELRLDDVVLTFHGDVFEMEDQRNWTDASFKTYSRPLALPYPYRVDAGEAVRQSITIRASGAQRGTRGIGADVIELRPAGAFPAIGVEASTAPDPVAAADLGAFRVVELDLTTPTWPAALARAAADGRPLDVRLVTRGTAQELSAAAAALCEVEVLRITPFDSDEHITTAGLLGATRAALATAPVHAPLLAGSRSHFTELNREQARIPREVDGIVVNTTPLFHALDTEQLVEAVAVQRLIAEQSVRIADGRPVHIGPVSLRPRFNNVATTPEPSPDRADLSKGYGAQFTGAVDERQTSAELAAWVVASAAASAVPGVATLSWFETTGPRGLEGTPAAEAIAALEALACGELLTGPSPDGLIWAIGSRRDGADTVLVANLDRIERAFSVDAASVALAPGSWSRITRR